MVVLLQDLAEKALEERPDDAQAKPGTKRKKSTANGQSKRAKTQTKTQASNLGFKQKHRNNCQQQNLFHAHKIQLFQNIDHILFMTCLIGYDFRAVPSFLVCPQRKSESLLSYICFLSRVRESQISLKE